MPITVPPPGAPRPGSTTTPTDPNTPATGTGAASGTTGATGPTATNAATGITGVASDSVSSSGGTSSGGLIGRAKTKLVEKTWDELTKRHSIGVDLDLGGGTLGVKLSERVFLGDSEFVTADPTRAATTARLEQETGENVFWLETGGLMDANIGLSKSIPLSGVINVHGGFNTKAALEYRSLHPHTADVSDVASDLVKNHSVRLPTDAETALGLEPGTQVEVIGRGTATLSAGISAGATTSVGSASGGVGLSIGGSTARSGTWSVGVTRLDGDKVRVLLSEVQSRTRAANLSLNAGLALDGDEVMDHTLGGTIDSSVEDVGLDSLDDMPGIDDDGIAGLVKKQGAKVLEKAVRKYTAFHASKGRSANETRKDVTSYVLDLSSPAGRKAYDELLRLDEGSAKSLAERSPDAISRHVYAEVATSTGSDAAVTFAGAKLLLFNALRKETEGTLTTGSGTELIRTSRYNRRYNGIITGERNIKWEGVSVRDAASGLSENFFHMRFSKDDKVTHNSEVREFVRFADHLGAKDADDRDVTPVDSNFLTRLFGSNDNSRVTADIYFSDAGVRRIADSSKAEVVGSFVDAATALNPDLGEIPLGDPTAVNIMQEYSALEAELRTARRHGGGGRGGGSDEQQIRSAQWRVKKKYKAAGYDKDLLKDHASVHDAGGKLASRITEMGADQDNAWTGFFADLGQASKFDYMGSIGALAKLAGADETLLHEVSFEGAGVHLSSVDEGSLADPSVAVAAATTGHV